MATDQPVLHFPVNALINKSLHIFEELGDKYEFQRNQKKGLSNKIKVICTDDRITNFAECKQHFDEETNNPYYQITVWDNYCQFLWAFCYASLVFMDERIIKPFLKSGDKLDASRLSSSVDLFMAGMSLFNPDEATRASRSKFFELPNPVKNSDDKTVETANILFVGCMCFVLFHEYHHFDLDHMERAPKKSDEYDADCSAFYSMYEDQSLVRRKSTSLSIILTLGSMLMVDGTLAGGTTHPDPDDRLGSILTRLHDLDQQGIDYCYSLATTIYELWAFYYSKTELIPKVEKVADMKEYFEIVQAAVSRSKFA